MNIKVYKGQSTNGTLAITRDVARCNISDTHIAVSIKGGLLTKDITSGEIVTVVITGDNDGTTSRVCKYISYNYQIVDTVDNPNAETIADNTLLFEILY